MWAIGTEPTNGMSEYLVLIPRCRHSIRVLVLGWPLFFVMLFTFLDVWTIIDAIKNGKYEQNSVSIVESDQKILICETTIVPDFLPWVALFATRIRIYWSYSVAISILFGLRSKNNSISVGIGQKNCVLISFEHSIRIEELLVYRTTISEGSLLIVACFPFFPRFSGLYFF